MARILVVEDNRDIQSLLLNFLEADGHEVCLAGDGVEALDLFRQGTFELVLLDIMLPKIDGYGVLELVRRESSIPVVMLTALDSEESQIKGYDLQADDYITKPFSLPVLLRKVAAVLRRTSIAPEADASLVRGSLALDEAGHRAFLDGVELELTMKEFELLLALMQNPGMVLTRQRLLDRIWDDAFFGDERVVDTHVKNLRKKGINCIETVRGVGYRVD